MYGGKDMYLQINQANQVILLAPSQNIDYEDSNSGLKTKIQYNNHYTIRIYV